MMRRGRGPGRAFTSAVLALLVLPGVAGCNSNSVPDLGPAPPTTSMFNGAAVVWERVPDPPLTPRNGSIAVGLAKRFVLVGGNDGRSFCGENADCGSAPAPFADGAAYDPELRQWERIADAPVALIGSSPFTIAGGALFVLLQGERSELLSYRPDDNAWTRLPAPHENHRAARLEPRGDGIVVIGVSRGSPPDELFDPATEKWTISDRTSGPDRPEIRSETEVPAGWNVQAPGERLSASDGWLWDLRTGERATTPGPDGPRRQPESAAWVGHSLFAIGGLVENVYGRDERVYDSVWMLTVRPSS